MDRESAKYEIKDRVSCLDYLVKSDRGQYCCPFCNSGYGPNRSGAVKYYPDGNKCYCHSCEKTFDVIDLYQVDKSVDYNTALHDLAEEIGITIDPYRITAAEDFGEPAPRAAGAPDAPQADPGAATEPTTADYTEYYKACRDRLTDPAAEAYLRGRGIGLDTAQAYLIGFDPAADPASAPGAMGSEYKPHPCPRIILPSSRSHYLGRSIDPNTPEGLKKLNPSKEKGAGSPGIFNARVIDRGDPVVFVCEGTFDALSFLEVAAPAVALNSAANADKLLKHLETHPTKSTLVLALDTDKRGKAAQDVLKEGLTRLNISFIVADVCGGHKDPNEALTADREAFTQAVERARRQAGTRPDNTATYIDTLMGSEIERFRQDKKTGFPNLDEKAGGLYAGLYVLAAISSLGKTSFALQLADQLATSGQDVIYFSLEQSRLELVSKSIARGTAQAGMKKAVSSLSIRRGYTPREVQMAAKAYQNAVADRISIVEGNFQCDISFIGEYIRQYIRRTGTRPVVFIDYLQILQPLETEKRQTTKETVDNTVTALKRLSRELELTIIAISSVNRANYLTPFDFESLKESGGIEFTADVIWGLQLQCLNEPLFDKPNGIKEKRARIKAAKAEIPRKIELSCVKNRYGISNYSCFFNYYPANDLFIPTNGEGLDYRNPTGETPKAGRKL